MKRLILSIICFLLLITRVNALELSSKHIVLYNLNDNEIVYEEGKDEKTSIASLTKIMTTLVAIENIPDFNETITIKSSMFYGLEEANASVAGLRNNQKVTYNDLLYGLFLPSGADAARALAITLAGSEEKFVDLMNQKAIELGLKNTHFVNSTGLDAENHYSTVNDVAIILKYAYQNKKFKEIFEAETYTFSDKTLTVRSTFRKTAKNSGIDTSYIKGAKTGYTYEAGRCLASIAYDEKNQITYLLVTTEAEKTPNHIKDAKNVYDYYFENYKYHNLVNKNDLLVTIPTKYSKTKKVNFYAKEDISKYLSNDFNKEDVTIKYVGEKIITPKMKTGTNLGTIDVIYNGEVVEKINVTLESKISFSLTEFLLAHKIIVVLVVFLIIAILIIRIKLNKKRKKALKQRKRNK